MSLEMVALGWKLRMTPAQREVFMAMADHATSIGTGIKAEMALIAHKVDMDVRTVRRIIRQLEDQGLLVLEKRSRGRSANEWRIDLTKAVYKPEFRNPVNLPALSPEPGQVARVNPVNLPALASPPHTPPVIQDQDHTSIPFGNTSGASGADAPSPAKLPVGKNERPKPAPRQPKHERVTTWTCTCGQTFVGKRVTAEAQGWKSLAPMNIGGTTPGLCPACVKQQTLTKEAVEPLFTALSAVFNANNPATSSVYGPLIGMIINGKGNYPGLISYEATRQQRRSTELDFHRLADDVERFRVWQTKVRNRAVPTSVQWFLPAWADWRAVCVKTAPLGTASTHAMIAAANAEKAAVAEALKVEIPADTPEGINPLLFAVAPGARK